MELVFGELHEVGGIDACCGGVVGARVSIVGDSVGGVEAAECGRAEFDVELVAGLDAGFFVRRTLVGYRGEGVLLFWC